MLKKLSAPLFFSVVLVAGCSQLPQLPQLPQLGINQATTETISLGRDGGYQAQVSMFIPADSCDNTAFKIGFVAGYMLGWNNYVGFKENQFRLITANKPSSDSAFNYSLYKGKQFNLKGVDLNPNGYKSSSLYVTSSAATGDNSKFCSSISYERGKNAGRELAYGDYKKFMLQER